MPNLVNQMTVRVLSHELSKAEGVVMVSFGGLDVATTEKIRGSVASKGASMRMVRNKLARRVLEERGHKFEASALEGNVAIAWGDTEAVIGAAKVFTEKDVVKTKKVEFRGAILEGQTLDAESAKGLADLPDKDTMRAMMLGLFSAPARGLVTVMNAVPAGTVRVLQARVDKEGGGEG